MNFRLPFQISRVSAICQSSSAVNLISKFTPIYGNHVKNKNKDKQNNAHHARFNTNKCTYKAFHSPFNVYQQKAFIHDIADTEEAVKRWVRYEQNCDCECPEEPKLAFRQSSKIECFLCTEHKPCVAPPLVRPKKLYDDSQCQYEHKCIPNLCNIDPPRMDNICCLQVVRKKLPNLRDAQGCCPCIDPKPLIAPRLCRPPKLYDPDQMERDNIICDEPKCVRMDDICGYKEGQKELPVLPENNCKPCLAYLAMKAPKLKRPLLRYDPTCIPYPHTVCPCEIKSPRRDCFICEPIFRDLPPTPCSDCPPCQPHVPTMCPLLKRLEARYDQADMQYKHECPESPCDTPTLRRDNNIISVTLTRKKLPRLCEDDTCKPCMDYRPLTAPVLKPPIICNDNLEEEQKREQCDEPCIRRDGAIKILRKCLPRVPTSDCCNPCFGRIAACTTPNFVPPKKLYDDTQCKYRHECVISRCEENPPRLDDKCFKVTPKQLPKPPDSPDCKPCIQYPKIAPRLVRPCKRYDDKQHKFKHSECPVDVCKIKPRADDVTGITDETKCLKTYKPLKCTPCLPHVPCKAPVLRRPRARYNDACMLYEHKDCPVPCEETAFRRDQCLLSEGPKQLPKIKCDTICCEPCQVHYPTCAPPLRPPPKLYECPCDPVRYKECPEVCPPRRDDLLCWKPKRKKLPSFKDCCQCCYYSTLSRGDTKPIQRHVNSKSQIGNKLFPKITTSVRRNFSTNQVPNVTKLAEKQKLYKSKNCNDQQTQIGQSSMKTKRVRSDSGYYVVNEPTWKCIDGLKRQTINVRSSQKKYDYSVERWLKEGAEELVKATSKSNSCKRNHSQEYCRFSINSKYSTGTECITPVKFTGFDNSGNNHYFCIKKNNKLQPLRIGNAFKSNECFRTTHHISFNNSKAPVNAAMCVSKNIKINLNKTKITTTSVRKQSNKHFTFPIVVQEHIHQHITSNCNLPTSNFILRLNNKMRSTLFQKISNFFKHRENAAKHPKIINSPKNESNLLFKGNKISSEFLANMCKKYDIELNLNSFKTDKNKPLLVQSLKKQDLKVRINKPTMQDLKVRINKPTMQSCSNSLKNRDEITKSRSLPKNIKMKVDQLRNFSTNCKDGKLCYKHIDISDDYIGKIYKVKLKKIGVKNLMLEKNDPDKMDEEPHTICYICKVVPRYQPIFDDDPLDIGDVKINNYKEKRNTIE